MKIKSVSILGFKSFMGKLDISFAQGISGVVGPNGCGKSNVVDAIRWCMGEQSPKQLRGRRMEDIIFNGAGEHKPLGMAEVTLLFENGDGSFPSPFTHDAEMAITRRLYRSGESEYLINRVHCRLKDLQEVFMDTGLGNRAYSIIGQGKIGTIIEQRPEETRVMLEEAAGVTKYRKKVEVSQRKIEATNANLQRVEDILGEVQSQMRSLKRQAAKARRYKEVCEEIRDLELILHGNTYNQLKEESGKKSRSTEDLVSEEIAGSTEISGIHARTEAMNLELEEKDVNLSVLRKNHLDLTDRVHKKEAGIESLAGEMRMLEELKTRLETEQKEIGIRLENLRREKEDLEAAQIRIREKSVALDGEISLSDERVRARKGFLKEIREDYERARSELSAGENREVSLNHESGYLNKLLDQITDSRSRMEQELAEINSRIEKIIKASERKSAAREAVSERLQEIKSAIEDENRGSEELEMIGKRVENELKSAEGELNMCLSRLTSLEGLAENFEGYQMGVRTIMKAKDFGPLKGGRVLGILADAIHVDPKYERAVEAVLAEKLQYVMVESQEDGVEAVGYLRERTKGRGSFAPLRDLEQEGGDVEKYPGFSYLLDHVSTPEKYAPLIKALLKDTVIVDDLDRAVSDWKRIRAGSAQNAKVPCLVTFEGDIIDRMGVISGGRLSQGSKGLLLRKREIEDLRKDSVKLKEKVEGLQLKLDDISARIEEKRGALEGLTEDKWSRQDDLNEYDKMLFRLGQELDQLEKLSTKISDDLNGKEIEQRKHKRDLVKLEEQLQERKARKMEEEAYFLEKERELRESDEEFEQLREVLSGLKSELLLAEEELRSAIREADMVDDNINDSLNRLEKIEEDISQGYRRRDECQRKKTDLMDELDVSYGKLKEAEKNMNRADLERRELQERIREKESKAEVLRGEIDLLREEINRAKMEQSEITFKMDNLVETVRDKFNLSLSEIYEQYLQEDFSLKDAGKRLENQKELRQRMGEVNLTAIKELEALSERLDFITGQRDDLTGSIEALQTVIKKINRTSLEKFKQAFQDIDAKLKEIFPILFDGGTAGLRLTDEARPLESGVLVEVQPPGKKLSHMGLLSGGEKALVAMTLIFAIYMVKPSPFCLLDEVDAPLDEANIDRFNNLLREIKHSSQIIMVTHSRKTMEISDRLYGITMEERGVSKLVSVDIQGVRDHALGDAPNDRHALH